MSNPRGAGGYRHVHNAGNDVDRCYDERILLIGTDGFEMMLDFVVHVVDDDDAVRDALLELFGSIGYCAAGYASADSFLQEHDPTALGCLVLDIRMPGMSGLELQKKLHNTNSLLPIIFITGHADVPMAVEAIKRGALEFIQKPFREQQLLDSIQAARLHVEQTSDKITRKKSILQCLDSLTVREREALNLLSDGHPNKVIASKMGISQRTAENHRANLLEKMGARSTAALIKLMVLANS